MAIGSRLRFEILRRDGFACRYCGARPEDGGELVVDHVLPVALGGSDQPENLVAACAVCNSGKASVPLDAVTVAEVNADALAYGAALRQAVAEFMIDRAQIDAQLASFDEEWCSWRGGSSGEVAPRDGDWRESVERFLALGVPLAELERLVRLAMSRPSMPMDKVWRSFCKKAWDAVDEIQQRAVVIVAER